MCLELVSPHARGMLDWVDTAGNHAGTWTILVRAAGSGAVQSRYARELGSAVTWTIHQDAEARAWSDVVDFPSAIAKRQHNALVLQVAVPLDAVARAVEAAEAAALEQNFICASVGRIGVGTLLFVMVPLVTDPPAAMQYVNAVSSLRGRLVKDSSAVVLRCPTEAKRHFSVWGTSPTDWVAMQMAKRALDPKYTLNRGRFLL